MEKFTSFHENNPHVYDILVSLARKWVRKTHRDKVGIGMLYEIARWQVAMTTIDQDYKLCNDYRAYYARLIMAQEPDLSTIFNLRKSAADKEMGLEES